MKHLIASIVMLAATPALAGDPAAGEKLFSRCKACHSITAPDGTAIQKGGKIGPNLFGVIGRQIGTVEGYAYSAGTIAAGADGTVWDEAMLAEYLPDPSAWLESKTGDATLHSKMTFKLNKGGEDVAAYLASVAPAN
ncbi:MAG: cytochrome C [bacterium]